MFSHLGLSTLGVRSEGPEATCPFQAPDLGERSGVCMGQAKEVTGPE